MQYVKVSHQSVPPVYDVRSRVLILGSIPSPKSREAGFYYAHPQNRFWPVLAAVFGAPLPRGTEERRAFALDRRIALWDVIAECEIKGASDASIRNAVPNDFGLIAETADLRAVFTVGKTASELYKKFTGANSFYLPSPSGANCAVGFGQLQEAYAKILSFVL